MHYQLSLQFHFDLGMQLYSVTDGQDLCDTIFQIVNQINHGVPNLVQEQEREDIAELNFKAGSRAMDFSDYEMAHSYLSTALSLLPPNHWSIHYEMSLRMYFVAANTAYTSGNNKKAFELLKSILGNGRCIEDKLDAYYLYAMMHHAREQSDEGYDTCVNVLQQFGETFPTTITLHELHGMMTDTGKTLAQMSNADIQNVKSMDNSSSFRYYIKFFSLLVSKDHTLCTSTCYYICILTKWALLARADRYVHHTIDHHR